MDTLSIVFQGPVGPGGYLSRSVWRNLQCTRQVFPAAQIIVSTWRTSPEADRLTGRALDALDIRLVLSDDPGVLAGTEEAGTHRTNLNRLRVSAQAGLARATRPLAVRLRTDTRLSGRQLVPLLAEHVLQAGGPARDGDFRVFRARVINASWFARDARGSLPYLFHPGDILLAGWTEDVRLFFAAPQATAALFRPARTSGLVSAWQYVPEQWFWVHAIQAVTGKRVFPGNFTQTPAVQQASEQYFLANFVPYSPHALGLHWAKYWRCYPLRGLFSTVTHRRWRHLLRAYQAGQPGRPYIWPVRLLTGIWRNGYRLRTWLLGYAPLRRWALHLFSRRH